MSCGDVYADGRISTADTTILFQNVLGNEPLMRCAVNGYYGSWFFPCQQAYDLPVTYAMGLQQTQKVAVQEWWDVAPWDLGYRDPISDTILTAIVGQVQQAIALRGYTPSGFYIGEISAYKTDRDGVLRDARLITSYYAMLSAMLKTAFPSVAQRVAVYSFSVPQSDGDELRDVATVMGLLPAAVTDVTWEASNGGKGARFTQVAAGILNRIRSASRRADLQFEFAHNSDFNTSYFDCNLFKQAKTFGFATISGFSCLLYEPQKANVAACH